MSFYDEMKKVADDLLYKFGQDITITRNENAEWVKSYDNVLSKYKWTHTIAPFEVVYTTPPPQTFTGKGVVTDYKTHLIDETVIKRGDKMLVLTTDMPSPKLTDVFAINGENWKMVYPYTEVNPAGTKLVYKLQVRK